MYDVVTIGDCFEDIFLFPRDVSVVRDRSFKCGKGLCFGYGDKIAVEEISYQIGGSAANTVMNFSKLGLASSLISVIGDDSQGERIESYFHQNKIDTSLIKHKTSRMSNISVILSYKGDRTILTYHGANDYADFIPNKNLKARWFYLAPLGKNSSRVENRIIEIIAKTSARLIWNPGNCQLSKKARNYRHLLRFCNIIFLNREEAAAFVDWPGKETTEEVMKIIHSYGARIVVVTDGKNGARCYDGNVFYKIPTTGDERVDATGAGDAFASGFSANVILSASDKKAQATIPDRPTIEESLKWGIIVSGSVVGQIGAHNGLLSPTKIAEHEKKLVKLEPSVYTK